MAARHDAKRSEAQYEPGSRRRVLRNLLGIKRRRDMELAESQALTLVQREAIRVFPHDHRFNAADIRSIYTVPPGTGEELRPPDGNGRKGYRPEPEERFFQ